MANINEFVNFPETKPPQFRNPSIVKQGFVLLIIYLILGVIIYSLNRDNFRANKTHPVVVSTLAVAGAFLCLAEARKDKRQRRMAKWVLDQHMTVAQFLASCF